jgi:vacuolar-type H+-ATPase subunit I/STV1
LISSHFLGPGKYVGANESAAKRLELAVARLEASVAARTEADSAKVSELQAELAEVTAERDELRGATRAAGQRIDHSLAAIRTLLGNEARHG